jgi:hypothetical protein
MEDLHSFLSGAGQIVRDPMASLVNGHTVTGWDLFEESETAALLDIIGG